VFRSRIFPLRPWMSSSVLFCRAIRRAVLAASACAADQVNRSGYAASASSGTRQPGVVVPQC
jgi:hypothetical protein